VSPELQAAATARAQTQGTRLGATLTLTPLAFAIWKLATSESAKPFSTRFVNWISDHVWVLWAIPLAIVVFFIARAAFIAWARAKYSKPRPPWVVSTLAALSLLVHAWNGIFGGTPLAADEEETTTSEDPRLIPPAGGTP